MDKSLEIDGKSVGFAQYGDPAGYPIVYFHAGGSCRLDIKFADAVCRAQGVRIIAADRPGIGLSSPNREYAVVDFARTIENLVDRLEIERFGVLGWSAGGAYALACAAILGDRVSSAATVGGMAPLSEEKDQQIGLSADHILFRGSNSSRGLRAFFLKSSRLRTSKAAKSALLKSLESEDDIAVVNSLSEENVTFMVEATSSGTQGAIEDYRAIRAPWGVALNDIKQFVSLWHGEEDLLMPAEHAHALKEKIPNAVFQPVAGKGHFLLHREIAGVIGDLIMQASFAEENREMKSSA